MKLEFSVFPKKSSNEIKQACKEACDKSSELISDTATSNSGRIPTIESLQRNTAFLSINMEDIKQRYDYYKYLIDPNKFRFRKVVRIVALPIIFIKRCKQKSRKPPDANAIV